MSSGMERVCVNGGRKVSLLDTATRRLYGAQSQNDIFNNFSFGSSMVTFKGETLRANVWLVDAWPLVPVVPEQ